MIDQHVTRIRKKGAIITMVDPAKQIIHARLAANQDVPVHAFTYAPTFRWPKVGEEWILREENGSWFLDSLNEQQKPFINSKGETIPVQPGDVVLTSPTGTIWKNVDGQLEPLTESSKFGLIEKYVKQPGPFFEGQPYIASTEFVTLALISHGGPPEQKTLYIDNVEVAQIQFQGSIIPFTIIIPKGQSWEITGALNALKSVAYAFFPS